MLFFKFIHFIWHVFCLLAYICTMYMLGVWGGQKRTLVALELQLERVVSHHAGTGGTEPGSSRRATSALSYGVLSSAWPWTPEPSPLLFQGLGLQVCSSTLSSCTAGDHTRLSIARKHSNNWVLLLNEKKKWVSREVYTSNPSTL